MFILILAFSTFAAVDVDHRLAAIIRQLWPYHYLAEMILEYIFLVPFPFSVAYDSSMILPSV